MACTSRRWRDWASGLDCQRGGLSGQLKREDLGRRGQRIMDVIETALLRETSPYALLRPVRTTPRQTHLHPHRRPLEEINYLWEDRDDTADPMALDVETTGRDPLVDKIVGIGFSDKRGNVYISLKEDEAVEGLLLYILKGLAKHKVPLIAHNLFFDGSFVASFLRQAGEGVELNWLACTYAAYKLTATEGWPGQSWSLKTAMTELLGWRETNESRLDNWLIDNGYHKNVKKEPAKGYYTRERWPVAGKKTLRYVSPDKGQMSKAPSYILGPYCGLDTDATYRLWVEVLKPVVEDFRALSDYFYGPFMNHILRTIRQKLVGITVDIKKMKEYRENLLTRIEQARQWVFALPEVAAFAVERREAVMADLLDKRPEPYLKFKVPKEPKKYTKRGPVSGSWLTWRGRLTSLKPKQSKNFLKWRDKYLAACLLKEQDYLNLSSPDQIRELVYGKMGLPVLDELRTKTGLPGVDKKAMTQWGEIGKRLRQYSDLAKELTYVESGIEHTTNGRIHFSFRTPGTLTGRLAGSGGINGQQLPKSLGYLKCYRPEPGRAWVDVDVAALEQVVLTELSRDATLWTLYSPEAKPNDVYLFNGANLPGLSEYIRAHGYDPLNPTPEAIAVTKKKEKKWRAISKTITLGKSYGMGAGTLQMNLKLQGILIPFQQARELSTSYDSIYADVKEYEKELLRQYRANGGWVLNGMGRPVGIHQDYTKDIVNRVVQSCGHDLVVIWIDIFCEMLNNEGIEWEPVFIDFHDESIIECKPEDVKRVTEIMQDESFAELNRRMQGVIPLKGDGGEIKTLAQAKCED